MNIYNSNENLIVKEAEFNKEFFDVLRAPKGSTYYTERHRGLSGVLEDINGINFIFLSKKFYVESEVISAEGYCIFKTYHKTTDKESYPNYKLTLLPEMTILIDSIGRRLFKEEKLVIHKLTGVSINISLIDNLSRQYLEEMEKVVINLEKGLIE